jgi:Beta-carotene isomerase D27-like, C-terminal
MQPKALQPITKDEYNDNLIDRAFIWLFSLKMSQALSSDTKLTGYSGFVDLSKQIMQGRNGKEQQAIVAKVLQSLIPAPVLWVIRKFFSPTRLVCVLNAWFAAQMFEWLVGPCEVAEAEINLPDGTMRSQPSAVSIKKCRYLVDSGCVGMCVNMCKVPTQEFFTEKFGIPLTMTPNFEDLSCKMIFGQIPLALDIDPDYKQSCLQYQCPTSSISGNACPKLSLS